MKSLVLGTSLLLICALPVCADQAEIVDPGEVSVVIPGGAAPIALPDGPSVLYDNGPLTTSLGTGVGGEDESVLQSLTLGLNTLGFGHQVAFDNRVSDQFTADANWSIDAITFFAYQTGSPTTSTMTAVNLRILDAAPPGGAVVFGDTATNVMTSTGFSNILRVTEATTGTTNNRPIMAQRVEFNPALDLPAGTYWLDWQTDGTLGSGPWAPPVSIVGMASTGDGLQSVDGGVTYTAANDTGTNTPQQGFPFIIEGTGGTPIIEVPTANRYGMMALVLLLMAGSFLVFRRMN